MPAPVSSIAPSFSLMSLGPIINRWKKFVGGAVVLAALVSIVVSLLMPNVYRSTAIFIPTNPQTADPDRLLENGSKLELGGRAEDLDRAISIGESQPVAEYIIRKFDLHKHYKATDRSDETDNFVLTEFSNNLTIVHNERDAIELTFSDKDKKTAAAVANDLVHVIDSVNQQLTLENRRTVLDLYRKRYESLSTAFERSRQELVGARRRYGIFGLEMQGRYMAKQIIETEAALRKAEGGGSGDVAGLRRALRGLTRADGGNLINLENYVRGADSLSMFTTRVADLQGRLISARSAYETAALSISGRLSSVYLVQKAYPATKKFKPVRSAIVLLSMVFTFALAVVAVALLELYRYNRTRPA